MITKIINCKHYYKIQIKNLLKNINKCLVLYNKKPKLTIITLDNYFATNLYIKNKIKSCIITNTEYLIFKTSKNIKTLTLIKIIKIINKDKDINSIIIQLPLPKNIFKKNIFLAINTKKDIDFINPKNLGYYISGYKKKIYPCTPKAIENIIEFKKIKTKGLKICLLGFSNIIGKPITYTFSQKGMILTITNKNDNEFKKSIKNSDIIITALGKKKHIEHTNLPYGGMIIDVGINKTIENLIIGDVNIKKKINRISYITSVPNGVGLLTILNLLKNNYNLFLFQNKFSLN